MTLWKQEKIDITFSSIALFPNFCIYVCGSILTFLRMEPLNQNLPIDDRIFVSLLEDSGFKAVMADKDNKQLLIGLLNEVLPPHDHIVDIVQYLDREQGLNIDIPADSRPPIPVILGHLS